MSELSLPRKLVLAVAKSYLWVREHGGDNHGEAVEEFLRTTGLGAGHPWCAAFVAFVGKATLGEDWPLPLVAGCVSLRDAAEQKGILSNTPQEGDVFLLWFPSMNRFAHTGFVESKAPDGKWNTIEGNAADPSKPSSRNGWGVFRRQRTFSDKDRFIRW